MDIPKQNSLDAEIQINKILFKEIEQMNPEENYAGVSLKVGQQFRLNEIAFIKALKTSSNEMKDKVISWVVQDCAYLNLKEIKAKTERLLNSTTFDQQEKSIINDMIKAFDEKLKSKESSSSTSINDLINLMKGSKGKDGALAEDQAFKLGTEFRKNQYSFLKAMSKLSKEDQKIIAGLTAYNCSYFDLEAIKNETKKLNEKNLSEDERAALIIMVDQFEKVLRRN